jgi:hypothetical protein
MTLSRRIAALLILTAFSTPGFSAEATTFDSCTDAAGRTLAAEVDYGQKVLVRTDLSRGQPIIRYNPGVLPRLTFDARLFLYMHQCARPPQEATLTQARQADCVALASLVTGGIMTREDIPALLSKLSFTESEWELLPGPQRGFDLASCRTSGALRLPSSATPSARQTEWNDCSRACGDRLWACQKRCRGDACAEACMNTHGACVAACGEKPPKD